MGTTQTVLFNLTDKLPIMFSYDMLSWIFALISVIIWALCGIYSIKYFSKDKNIKLYSLFYFLTLAVIIGMDFAGNLVTFYACYELMTLLSVPLVFHNRTKEALMAALKYLFYSLCGAYMVLFGFYFVYSNASTIEFRPGGVLSGHITADNRGILMLAVFLMIMGFSIKGGMFPMHAWLTAAHPVAPAPASAFLSGIIVKAGVLGMIRVIYFIAGPDFIRGTYIQYVIAGLSIFTVFMGSMLAYREKLLKKRLAYSTVSQVSYIIFGLIMLEPMAFTGAISHVVFHAIIKAGLFLFAGVVIHETGKERVDQLKGMGKQMPLVWWSYTILSLALIGIPPAAGFISKWYLCGGALNAQVGVFAYLGPAMLLVSALLTAGYLLPIVIEGFLPGKDFETKNLQKIKVSLYMLIPVVILGALSLILGIVPGGLTGLLQNIAATLM